MGVPGIVKAFFENTKPERLELEDQVYGKQRNYDDQSVSERREERSGLRPSFVRLERQRVIRARRPIPCNEWTQQACRDPSRRETKNQLSGTRCILHDPLGQVRNPPAQPLAD